MKTYKCARCGEVGPWPDDLEELEADMSLVCEPCHDAITATLDALDPEQLDLILDEIEATMKDELQ